MSSNFLDLANKTLNEIVILLSEFDDEKFEIDFIDNNLNIEFDNGKLFIISIHEPTSQLWLSSPISGAHHFHQVLKDDLSSWQSTRNKEINLFNIIKTEIEKEINEP